MTANTFLVPSDIMRMVDGLLLLMVEAVQLNIQRDQSLLSVTDTSPGKFPRFIHLTMSLYLISLRMCSLRLW